MFINLINIILIFISYVIQLVISLQVIMHLIVRIILCFNIKEIRIFLVIIKKVMDFYLGLS